MKSTRVSIGSAVVVAVAMVLALGVPCLGHGYVSTPLSRQAQCRAGNVANCGPIIYEPQSVEAPKGQRTCNGGIAQWAQLADESKAWPVTSLSSGVNTFRWTLTAVHVTASWEYYIGNTRIAIITGSSTTHSVDLSGYTGRQKILAIWNIGDTAMAFYNCIDVNIGGSTTTPTTAPTTAPTTRPTTAPTTAPTTRPTTTPTTAPTTAPTTIPTTTPTTTPGSGQATRWYTVVRGDSLGAIARSNGITLATLLAANRAITNPDLIYVGQVISVPARVAAGLNATSTTGGGFGFTGGSSDGTTGVEETVTDNAVDLTSTGVGSHWYRDNVYNPANQASGGASGLYASDSHHQATFSGWSMVMGVTVLSVLLLVTGQ